MGLGNRLYPWARCHVFSVQNDASMLAPRWWWPPRVRPLLKETPPASELPGHLYVRGMRALPEYIGGVRRKWIESTSPGKIRVFRGEGARLQDLHGHAAILHSALQRISTVQTQLPYKYIALHVRRGDFSAAARTPIDWFVAALRAVRARSERAVPACIVSDGRTGELGMLLREPDTMLLRTGAPLADMLALAGARVLLASGSSFSAWASFLGGMPTVTQPGHSMEWFGVRQRTFLGHFERGAGNDRFLQAACEALS